MPLPLADVAVGRKRERQKLHIFSLPVGEPAPSKVPAWEHGAGESPRAECHKPGKGAPVTGNPLEAREKSARPQPRR